VSWGARTSPRLVLAAAGQLSRPRSGGGYSHCYHVGFGAERSGVRRRTLLGVAPPANAVARTEWPEAAEAPRDSHRIADAMLREVGR